MFDDIRAGINRGSAPQHDYDFTQEYLKKLRGEDYIPTRKREDYINQENHSRPPNYDTPLMLSLKSAVKPKGIKIHG